MEGTGGDRGEGEEGKGKTGGRVVGEGVERGAGGGGGITRRETDML